MTGNAAAVAYITEFKLLWLAATYTHRRITTRDDSQQPCTTAVPTQHRETKAGMDLDGTMAPQANTGGATAETAGIAVGKRLDPFGASGLTGHLQHSFQCVLASFCKKLA